MNAPMKLCSKPGCQVATTGKCDLGKDPVESCHNYAQPESAKELDQEPDPAPSAPKIEPVEICSGDVMHLDELSAFSRCHRIRSVSLIGEHKAGKTTLIAAIYEAFCKGPFAGLQFAGSRTLVGFSKRHYLALLNSKREEPTVPRTSRDDPVSFFHLALATGSSARPIHLIMSDRSGEAYADARTDTSLIDGLDELRLADRACFMLDGARLAVVDQRAAYTRQFKQMIHAFCDNHALANVKAIEILATKADVIQALPNATDHARFLDDYEMQIAEEFKGGGVDISFHRICALPRSDLSVGYLGLEEVIRRWTAPDPLPDVAQPPIAGAIRQLDQLLSKW
jgi:hypothetical protein